MKILVAVDGSGYSTKALDYLLARPEFAGATLHLAHVSLPVPPRAAAVVGAEIVAAQHAHDHDEALSEARRRLAAGNRPATEVLRVGMPAQELAQIANEGGYDLVVMGSHGQGAILGLLMGSVVSKVLATVSVPLLIVR